MITQISTITIKIMNHVDKLTQFIFGCVILNLQNNQKTFLRLMLINFQILSC